jgi:hypothetical protein
MNSHQFKRLLQKQNRRHENFISIRKTAPLVSESGAYFIRNQYWFFVG